MHGIPMFIAFLIGAHYKRDRIFILRSELCLRALPYGVPFDVLKCIY